MRYNYHSSLVDGVKTHHCDMEMYGGCFTWGEEKGKINFLPICFPEPSCIQERKRDENEKLKMRNLIRYLKLRSWSYHPPPPHLNFKRRKPAPGFISSHAPVYYLHIFCRIHSNVKIWHSSSNYDRYFSFCFYYWIKFFNLLNFKTHKKKQ